MYRIKFTSLIFSPLLLSISLFASNKHNIKDDTIVIIDVFNTPVAIMSNIDSSRSCDIYCGLLSGRKIKIHKGKTVTIPVIGDNDIIIQCKGSKGITISRD
jgi:hypothetical protein